MPATNSTWVVAEALPTRAVICAIFGVLPLVRTATAEPAVVRATGTIDPPVVVNQTSVPSGAGPVSGEDTRAVI